MLGSGDRIGLEELPVRPAPPPDAAAVDIPSTGLDLETTLAEIELRYIRRALERAGGIQSRAAELLGLTFRQFRYKLQKHGVRARHVEPDVADS